MSTGPLNSSKRSDKWDFETITIALFLSQKLIYKITNRKRSMLEHLLEIVAVFLYYFHFSRVSFLNKENWKDPTTFLNKKLLRLPGFYFIGLTLGEQK